MVIEQSPGRIIGQQAHEDNGQSLGAENPREKVKRSWYAAGHGNR